MLTKDDCTSGADKRIKSLLRCSSCVQAEYANDNSLQHGALTSLNRKRFQTRHTRLKNTAQLKSPFSALVLPYSKTRADGNSVISFKRLFPPPAELHFSTSFTERQNLGWAATPLYLSNAFSSVRRTPFFYEFCRKAKSRADGNSVKSFKPRFYRPTRPTYSSFRPPKGLVKNSSAGVTV